MVIQNVIMDAKYKAYLLSDEWKQLKIDLVQQRGFKCEVCHKKTKLLQLHHLTYERIYNENESDLQLLCGICHQKAHGLIKDKTKKPKAELYTQAATMRKRKTITSSSDQPGINKLR